MKMLSGHKVIIVDDDDKRTAVTISEFVEVGRAMDKLNGIGSTYAVLALSLIGVKVERKS